MALYVLADTHLGTGIKKTMDLFGARWKDHTRRLQEAWKQTVTDDDTVLVPGDISWGLKLHEALPDLKLLEALPGDKILLRGNHDYWWQSIQKIETLFKEEKLSSLKLLQNNAYYLPKENVVVAGSRGWLQPSDKQATGHDKKIYYRELQRLELSLKDAQKIMGGLRTRPRLLAILHYPPFGPTKQPTEVTTLLERYEVEAVYFGHIHHPGSAYEVCEWPLNGVRYTLIAADHLNFKPYKIPEEVRFSMPLSSMTGYGRGERSGLSGRVEIEMRSLNHRYLETYLRLPQELCFLDPKLRSRLKENVARGKVDVKINLQRAPESEVKLEVNRSLLEAYQKAYRDLSSALGTAEQLTAAEAFRLPEIVLLQEAGTTEDDPLLQELFWPAFEEALKNFLTAREKEGEALAKDIESRLEILKDLLKKIEDLQPRLIPLFKERLLKQLSEVLADDLPEYYPEQRLSTELSIYADKVAIAEETVRLNAHFKAAEKLLQEGGVCGKKFDFLIQEMNREVNTIASKANYLEVTQLTVEMKNQVEKIREQVQNIE